MRWNQVPEGASLAMSRDTAMEMGAGKPKAFIYGAVCGAVGLLMLQSCGGSDNAKTDKPNPSPGPSITATQNHN